MSIELLQFNIKTGTREVPIVEMAGIEPASEKLDQQTSTSVVFC